ncbi:MAG TPA: hypothetical protein DCP53_09345 [Elusimicrobia bacterium]|nr:MAG: hypothetical protein A2551_00190 [Elusimicrobia bacterium RIFOXYD2_FULL_34_30]HAM39578.1 hypothetical protein [Elusimicrobiota bacterium]
MKLIGHNKQEEMFLRAIEKNHIHSSYIFSGQSGIGKRLFALRLAKMLNCVGKISKRPCEECPSCKKIESGNHPDVVTISVLEEKSWISIDQIKDMIKSLQINTIMNGYNIRIIDSAHLIKEDAANSLLKILEEPPKNTVIILITPVPHSLPRTILSRCATVFFNVLSDGEIKKELEKYELTKNELDFVVSVAMGSLGKATELAQDKDMISKYINVLTDFKKGKFVNSKYERNEAVDFLNILASQVRYYEPEKVGIVLKMQNYIRRNTNIGLTLEVLRQNLL